MSLKTGAFRATCEAEIRRITQVKKKSLQDPISINSWVQWCTPVIPVNTGSIKQEDRSPGQPGQKSKTLSQK
jgi:hypothetical protein